MSSKKYKIVMRELEANGIKTQVKYAQEIPVMCKTCKEYSRRPSSAYCQNCADAYKNAK